MGDNAFQNTKSLQMCNLTSLQAIKLSGGAFRGDSSKKTAEEYPFNYNNTLIMRSRNDISKGLIDLPSLTSFIGGDDNFEYYGAAILDSICLTWLFRRHPFIIMQQYTVIEFQQHLLTSFFK